MLRAGRDDLVDDRIGGDRREVPDRIALHLVRDRRAVSQAETGVLVQRVHIAQVEAIAPVLTIERAVAILDSRQCCRVAAQCHDLLEQQRALGCAWTGRQCSDGAWHIDGLAQVGFHVLGVDAEAEGMVFIQLERHGRVQRHGFELDVGQRVAAGPGVAVVELGAVRHEHAQAHAPLLVQLLAGIQRWRGDRVRRVVGCCAAAGRSLGEVARAGIVEGRVRDHHGGTRLDLGTVQARHAGRVVEDGRWVVGFGTVGVSRTLGRHALRTKTVAGSQRIDGHRAQGGGNNQGEVFLFHCGSRFL